MPTMQELSIYKSSDGYYIAPVGILAPHAYKQRVSPFYLTEYAAYRALRVKQQEYMKLSADAELVASTLRRPNRNDPSEQWSAYDIANETGLSADVVAAALEELRPLTGGGRYVGGTSGHLYSL